MGTVYKFEDTEIRCSKSGPYNSTTSIDCGGIIHSLENGDACCGTNVMNSSTEVCCRNHSLGIAQPLTPEQCCANMTLEARDLPCCNGSLFNPKEQMCCQKQLFKRSGSLQCSLDPTFPVFDTLTHVEVKRSLHEFPAVEEVLDGKTSPCDGTLFNPNNSFCGWKRNMWNIIRIDSKSGAICGSVPYNKENATCCDGAITEGIPEIEGLFLCNDSIPVLISDSLICMGIVYSRSESIDEACCGTDTYRTDSQICCQGNIYDKDTPSIDCCGDSTFDRTSQLCYNGYYPYINKIIDGTTNEREACAGKLLQKNEFCKRDLFGEQIVTTWGDVDDFCGDFGFKRDKFFCDRDLTLVPHEPYEDLCNKPMEDVLFDTRTFICCGGDILPKLTPCGKERKCCNGFTPFVPELETCSQASGVWKVPSHLASICGAKIYNNQTHECDFNSYLVVEKGELERAPSVCLDNKGNFVRYSPEEHFCCGGKLSSKTSYKDPHCCNNMPYDRASPNHICCDGLLSSTGGVPMTCEGSVAYSEDQQVCGGFVYNKTDGLCCGSGVYDPEREHCCGDTVRIAKSSPTERCCGLTKFDEANTTLVCCGNSTLHEMVPGLQCCASSLMDPEESICLKDKFIISKEYEDKTCNASNVEHERGTCCAGILYVGQFGSCDGFYFVGHTDDQLWCGQGLLKHGEACCDGTPYDQGSHSCVNNSMIMPMCNGTVFDKSTQTCCNGTIINNLEKICCSGRIRNVNNGEDKCCRKNAYNSQKQVCCKNNVMELEDPTLDLKKCCDRNEVFHLTSGSCQEAPHRESGCPVCPKYVRSKSEITAAANESSHQVMIRVTGTSRRNVNVRILDLPRECSKCQQSFQDQQINQMVLPEGCECDFALNTRYVLLTQSPVIEGNELILSESAVILPRKHLNRVVRSIDRRPS